MFPTWNSKKWKGLLEIYLKESALALHAFMIKELQSLCTPPIYILISAQSRVTGTFG